MPHDFTGLPLDANGFTDYQTMIATEHYENSRVVFVSSTDGNDGTASIYDRSKLDFDDDGTFQADGSVNAYQTVGAAMAQMRSGFADICLLKRGDTFTGNFVESSFGRPVSGNNLIGRSIISSYGSDANRPQILTGLGAGVNASGRSFTILSGIRFYCNDWEEYDYDVAPNLNKPGRCYNAQTNSNHQLIEDCEFERYLGGRVEAPTARYITFRRNAFLHSNAHDGVLFLGGGSVWNCVEENLFYRPHRFTWSSRGRSLYISPGTALGDQKDHHEAAWVRGNVFFYSGRICNSFRASGIFSNNLFIECDLIDFGGVGGSSDTEQHHHVLNNVIADAVESGTHYGIQLIFQNGDHERHWSGAGVRSNLGLPPLSVGGSCTFLRFGSTGTWSFRNMAISDNVVFNYRGEGSTNRGISIPGDSDGKLLQDVDLTSNEFQMGTGGKCIEMPGGLVGGFNLDENHYWSTDDNPFTPGDNHAGWVTASGETNSEFSQITYTDSERRPSNYLGAESSNIALIELLKDQTRHSYNSDYTADSINSWLRAGFDITPATLPASPPDPAEDSPVPDVSGKVVIRQSNYIQTNSGSHTVELSGNPIVGNIVLVVFTSRNNPGTVTGPSGYTLIGESGGAGSSRSDLKVWMRVIDGTEESPKEITVSHTVARNVILWAAELVGTGDFDVSAFVTSNDTRVKTLTTGPTASVSSASNVAFAFVGVGPANDAWPRSEAELTDGFNLEFIHWNNNSGPALVMARKELNATTGVETTINLAEVTGNASGARMSGAIIVFEPAALTPTTISGERFEDTASLLSTSPNGGAPPYTYQWHRSTEEDFTPGESTEIDGATDLTLDDVGLERGVTYYYKLVVTDDDDDEVISNEIALDDIDYTPPVVSEVPHDFTGLPLDANGFTDYQTMIATEHYENSRVVFVSSTDGNDGTASIYDRSKLDFDEDGTFQADGSVNAYQTVGAAMAQMRSGVADICLLKRGDTFTGQAFTGANSLKSGNNLIGRSIISSYGSHADRPQLLTGLAQAVQASGARYTILSGIRFYADDWESYDYDDPESTSLGRNYNAQSNSNHQLIEDCDFERYRTARIEASTASYIVFRRNVWKYGNAHDGFLFYGGKSPWGCVEENVFYKPFRHRWNDPFGRTIYVSPGGGGTIEDKHHIEMVWFRNNIVYESGRGAVNPRASGPVTNNLIIRSDSGIQTGGHGGSGGSLQHHQVLNNVIAEAFHPGSASVISLHMRNMTGHEDGSWKGSRVEANLLLPVQEVNASLTGIGFTGSTDVSQASGVVIKSNVVFNHAGSSSNRAINFPVGVDLTNIELDSNNLQMTGGGNVISVPSAQIDNVAAQDNKYWSTDANPFSPGGDHAGWVAASGEEGSTFEAVSFTDSSRRVATYLDYESSEEFIGDCLEQARHNYDSDLTADAINSWLRAGVDMTPAALPAPPPDPAEDSPVPDVSGKVVIRQESVSAPTESLVTSVTTELAGLPQVGNTVVVVHFTQSNPGTVTGPDGYTLIGTSGGSGSSRANLTIWRRVITGDEENGVVFAINQTVSRRCGVYVMELAGTGDFDLVSFANSGDTRVKFLEVGPTASVSSASNVAFVFFNGASGSDASPSSGAALTDGFGIEIVVWENPFLVMARKELDATSGVEVTLNLAETTNNASGTRLAGAIIVFEPAALQPPTISGERFEDTASLSSTSPNGGAPPYTYQWHRSIEDDFTPGESTEIDGATDLTLDDGGLERGVTYYYKLVVTDDDDDEVISNEIALDDIDFVPPVMAKVWDNPKIVKV